MKIYKVGGCVRDRLLGLDVKDTDWVVVGASSDELLANGYKAVGKDFPVFLHPESHEEYALARTERKTAPGYTGFVFHAEANVTLEEDLQRRDLTINAIAEDDQGNLIDPWHGQHDLEQRILRHVSPAFSEDPVRILRLARFAARFADLHFTIADETMSLMQHMVDSSEVNALVAERVWQETVRALSEDKPAVYFQVLRQCGALKVLFPEVDRLFGVPQPEKYHPEIDTGIHTMMVLSQSALLSDDPRVRFAALVHDLGKGTTPKKEWPKHIAHEARGVPLVEALCKRLKVPREYKDLAVLVTRYHLHFHRAAELKDATMLKTLKAIDVFRRPERLNAFLDACEADARGRPGYETIEMNQGNVFRSAYHAADSVDVSKLMDEGFSGQAIADELTHRQTIAIREARKNLK